MAAVAVAFLKERTNMWPGLMSDDIDEGVFSVLNLDHDSFLSSPEKNQNETGSPDADHNLCSSNSCIRGHDSFCFSFSDPFYFQSIEDELCSEERLKTPLEDQLSEKSMSAPSVCAKMLCDYPQQQDDRGGGDRKHVTRRIQEDIKHGKSCTIFRTNINALRHYRNSEKPFDRLGTGSQKSWTSLQGLAAHAQSTLPIVVYKLFTRRPVVDICLRNSKNAPVVHSAAARSQMTWPRLHLRCCYKRTEHNDWRPCSVGILFDPDRCPARDQRGRRRAALHPALSGKRASGLPYRAKKQGISAPPPSAMPSIKSTTSLGSERGRDRNPHLSAKERERAERLVAFRRMYGYDREPSKGENHSFSRVSSRIVQSHGQTDHQSRGATPNADWTKERAAVESCSDTFNWNSYQAGDAYYSRLFSSWGY